MEDFGGDAGVWGLFVPVSQILDKRRRIWYNGDDGGGPLCPPPNNIEQEENTMFHGSTLGKIITLVNVVDEKRPSGCTRKKATYTICTGKDGYGKNSHFCNIDLVAIGGLAYEAEKKLSRGDYVYVTFRAEAEDNDRHFTFYVESQRRANVSDPTPPEKEQAGASDFVDWSE